MKPNNSFNYLPLGVNLAVDLSIKYLIKYPDLKDLSNLITVKDIKKRDMDSEFHIINKMTLPQKSSQREKSLITSKFTRDKNRYIDILAYEHNNYKLNKDLPLNEKNYINANVIKDPFEKTNKKAILTQGPLINTSEDFWKMAEKTQAKLILGIVENHQLGKKCYNYWPRKKKNIQLGDYIINNIENKSKNNNLFEYKVLEVLNIKNNKRFEIEHYYVGNWIDHGILGKDMKKMFLDLVEEIYNKYITDKNNDIKDDLNTNFENNDIIPLLAHCSAGVGRSGTFLTVLFLYKYFRACKEFGKEFKFSVFNTVRIMREQRLFAVQTGSQYAFIYDIVKEFK